MANQNDLRVVKTRKAIKQAFMQLILNKSVNKITVSELAKIALISKGTFYLHYADIYMLYDELVADVASKSAQKFTLYSELFTKPEYFVRQFLFAETTPPSRNELALLAPDNLRFSTAYPAIFIDAFRAEIYRGGEILPNKQNDIRIEFLVTGMISLLVKPGLVDVKNQNDVDDVAALLSGVIKQMFPEFYS
ncbi:TetR/AcrR family transcriptional regulator [Lactiplantibacillus herbarum]|uniref:TetR/AcrR family transcriptional regulator n=1 Tax=Lactiplantibacillus herbarum TaxID=1670446 RepID=UPI00069F60DD|nr:TetR/AcrR family transcriptional regulator [Lactiplantibacillus herbarum]